MIPNLGALSCTGFVAILMISFAAPRLGWGAFWPPPSGSSWQHRSFRALFRIGLYPLIAATALIARETDLWMPAIGLPLVALGFGGALAITTQMGWRQAFGEARSITTHGAFRYSRNPVYVCTWFGMVGWALCVPHAAVLAPLVLWALLYWIAPRLEEPWLEAEYGAAYATYKARTPRSIGRLRSD